MNPGLDLEVAITTVSNVALLFWPFIPTPFDNLDLLGFNFSLILDITCFGSEFNDLNWTSLILRCFYVVTIKCKRHLDVTMLSSYEVAPTDFVNFHLGRLFSHLAR